MVSASKIGFLLTGVVLTVYLLGDRLPVGIQLLDVLEFRTYDMRMRSEGTRMPAGDVTIAAIDEKSLAAIGRWPWSRRTQAELIDKLDALGARVIALDIFYSESENSKLLAHIGRLEAEQGGDR
jgi:adenylate cyclase